MNRLCSSAPWSSARDRGSRWRWRSSPTKSDQGSWWPTLTAAPSETLNLVWTSMCDPSPHALDSSASADRNARRTIREDWPLHDFSFYLHQQQPWTMQRLFIIIIYTAKLCSVWINKHICWFNIEGFKQLQEERLSWIMSMNRWYE